MTRYVNRLTSSRLLTNREVSFRGSRAAGESHSQGWLGAWRPVKGRVEIPRLARDAFQVFSSLLVLTGRGLE